MKTKNILTFMVLSLLGLSACSNGEELAASWQDHPEAVQFEPVIQKISVARTDPSDAKGTQFNVGDRLAVSSGAQQAVYQKGADGKWIPSDGQRFITWNSLAMIFNAQYPVGDVTQGFAVPADQSTVSNMAAADYMTYSGTHQNTNEPVKLSMDRKMARVHVTGITYGDGLQNDAPSVKAITFCSQSVVGGTGTPGYVDVTPLSVESGYMALVAPVARTDGQTFMKLTVAYQKNGERTKTFTVKNTPELKAGYSHEFTLKLKNDKVEMGAVSVSAWADGTGVDLHVNTDLEPVVDAAAHKVRLKRAGSLDRIYLQEAFGSVNNGSLWVEGPADGEDIQTIAAFCSQKGKSVILNLKHLTGVTSLPDNCFDGCKALNQITLPATLTEIGQCAFARTALTEFTVPSAVARVGNNFLDGCMLLAKVTLMHLPAELTLADNAFMGVPATAELVIDKAWNASASFKGGTFAKITSQMDVVKFDKKFFTIGDQFSNFCGFTSIELLVKCPDINAVSESKIFGSNNCDAYFIKQDDGTIELRLMLFDVAGGSRTLKAQTNIESGQWCHLAFSSCLGGDGVLYFNGQEVARQALSFNRILFWDDATPFTIGSSSFTGCLKEVRIWQKALTPEEIKQNPLSVSPESEGLLVYYKLDGSDITGTTVRNSAGNSCHGMLTNPDDLTLEKSDFIRF